MIVAVSFEIFIGLFALKFIAVTGLCHRLDSNLSFILLYINNVIFLENISTLLDIA